MNERSYCYFVNFTRKVVMCTSLCIMTFKLSFIASMEHRNITMVSNMYAYLTNINEMCIRVD